jgi:23S rRNA pseudouridine1911/1915/1917 synthase
MTDHGPLRFQISESDLASTLEALIYAQIGPYARELIAHGGVWVNGERHVDQLPALALGDTVILSRPPSGVYDQISIKQADILYEDEWILALYKHQGWYSGVVPWDIYGNSVVGLEAFLRQRDGGEPYLHMAHQLDRDTSGILIFSRHPSCNPALYQAFKEHLTHKRYLAICSGSPPDQFEVETGHGRSRGGRFQVYDLDEIGRVLPGGTRVKHAHTRFQKLQQLDGAALVEASPITGRTHQIRIHLAHGGYPLLGDTRYHGPSSFKGIEFDGHLLHAISLELPHPKTRQPLRLHAPLPEHMRALLPNWQTIEAQFRQEDQH